LEHSFDKCFCWEAFTQTILWMIAFEMLLKKYLIYYAGRLPIAEDYWGTIKGWESFLQMSIMPHTHTHTHTHKHLKSFSVQQSYILKTCLHIQERFGKSICCIFYVSLTLLWLLQLISSPWLMKVISALLSAIPSAATTVQFLPNSTQLVGAKATGKIINFTLQV